MKTPRPYQQAAIQAALKYRGALNPLWSMATGCGKTVTAAFVAKAYLDQGKRVLWMAHRKELVRQGYADLEEICTGHTIGYLMPKHGYDYDAHCIVASKDTLVRSKHLDAVGHIDLLIADEAHHYHSNTSSFKKICAALQPTKVLGLTATPDRADNQRLSDTWEIVYDYGMTEAMEQDYLLRPYATVCKPPQLDLSKVPTTSRDYLPAELERTLYENHIVEHTVAMLGQTHEASSLPLAEHTVAVNPKECGGILVYCVTIDQAERTACALGDAGWSVAVLHSQISDEARDTIMASFKSHVLQVIVNVGILTEGTDLPWAQMVVMARPTTSWPLYMQIVGRAVRPHEGQKRAYILDLVGATQQHSIVSAAVLVDGIDCLSSPDGAHHYVAVASGQGVCQHCQATIACHAYKGGHRFHEGHCKGCGTTQCPASPDDRHQWTPWEPGVRMCIYCGLNIPDPVSGMLGRINPPKEPVNWNQLVMDEADVWATHLGEQGILLDVRNGDLHRPYWYRHRDRQIVPLTKAEVAGPMARLLTDDIARRARKVRGQFGGHKRDYYLRAAMFEARRIALKHQIWEQG